MNPSGFLFSDKGEVLHIRNENEITNTRSPKSSPLIARLHQRCFLGLMGKTWTSGEYLN